jgi:hypothetical protein
MVPALEKDFSAFLRFTAEFAGHAELLKTVFLHHVALAWTSHVV